jgi:hypothetical protein
MKPSVVRQDARFAFTARMLAIWLFLGLLHAHATVIIGPWLEGDTTTNVDVLVECDSAAAMMVNFGLTTNYGASAVTAVINATTNGSDVIHRIKLAGLQSNMLYHYQLAGQGPGSADYTFSTVPGLAFADAPTAVQAAMTSVAQGRSIEKVERVMQFEGPEYRAYIANPLGPQLLTVDGNGQTIDNAVVIAFADLPEAVRNSARTAVAGRLQVCRKSLQRPEASYLIDYTLNEEEPVFALILEAGGLVRAVYGYNESDSD